MTRWSSAFSVQTGVKKSARPSSGAWSRFLSFLSRFTRDTRKLCLVAEGPNQGLAELRSLIEAGNLVPVIDRVFRLSEVASALRYFGEGSDKGKIVIAVTST